VPAVSQVAARRATTACLPARSWSRVITVRPSLTATSATVQPGSRVRTHGTSDADGTDWASSHSGSGCVQSRPWTLSEVLTAILLSKITVGCRATRTSSSTITPHSPTRRAVQRCTRIGWGGDGSSLTNSACRSRPCSRSIRRNWDGSASPRAAASASVTSSTLNRRSARW
jgi:hypothetical protein